MQDAYYAPDAERTIRFDDPEIGIEWPLRPDELVASQRDLEARPLREVAFELPFVYR
jgi:dTDP-4-dehydrorhamnose 3,5-epimerase